MILGFLKGPKSRFLVYRISFGGWEENTRHISDFSVGLNLPGGELCLDPEMFLIGDSSGGGGGGWGTPRGIPPEHPPQGIPQRDSSGRFCPILTRPH